MDHRLDLVLFVSSVTVASIAWGRVNRIGDSRFITAIVHAVMKVSRMNTELIRCWLVWLVYICAGLAGSVALLLVYRVNLLRFCTLHPNYAALVLLAFIAQNSLTGLMMHLLLAAKPAMNVFAEVTGIPWIRYTLMMPAVMRMGSPMAAGVVEEVFFRGAVFLILINRFPQTGAGLAIVICTVLFVVQQVLQTDTFGQGMILLIGSTSISIVGCLATLYTGSFLPTLLCHAAYAAFYFRLGTSMPAASPKTRAPKPGSAYAEF